MPTENAAFVDENWLGVGYTSTKIIDTITDCEEADKLAAAITKVTDEHRGEVLYVKLADGLRVHGFHVEAETLTDGGVAYNLILRAE